MSAGTSDEWFISYASEIIVYFAIPLNSAKKTKQRIERQAANEMHLWYAVHSLHKSFEFQLSIVQLQNQLNSGNTGDNT